jgi:uncharacterized protein with HEPN domain
MNDEASLLDILTHGQRAIRAANEKERFLNDDIAQSAVAYCISVMGEAVKRISPEFQHAHPEIRWSEIARMRDLLIHSYHRVNWNIVWDTVTNAIPDTLAKIEKLIPPKEME